VIAQNRTTRPAGLDERRRVEEQEEDQDHRKDPGFARPITLATTSSFGVGALCESFARFLFARLCGPRLEDGGISDGSSEVGGDVRATLDQGGIRGASLHGQAREVVGRSPLVPRLDAWDLALLAASSCGGLASCGGMRREPDVRQQFPASGPS
jgi:hypothetical protein